MVNESSRARRRFLSHCRNLVAGGAIARLGAFSGLSLGASSLLAQDDRFLSKTIPGGEESVPSVGMGTWITFNVGENETLRKARLEVLKTFFELGGQLVDSSPMYGTAEAVMGYFMEQLPEQESSLFSATKVWTRDEGRPQIRDSLDLWGLEAFDLLQVHNLVNWREHLALLRDMKEAGQVRYIGVTTSHGRRHGELEEILKEEPLDFVQLTYNIVDREAEDRLLPLAQDRGVAVIANRPYRQKQLFHRYQSEPLPDWADEVGCTTWADFFLKFIISHPALTCAIPATTQVEHMRENMAAMRGVIPDARQRERMAQYVQSL
ncbi:aldo/keto reductase [Marinimicrobium sp. C2-29]|uniref:aldo/keto reductase n=1 Tax=Marinimicrobium sp. C2-29 TaxID=3139825 RepID=UPI00313A10D8